MRKTKLSLVVVAATVLHSGCDGLSQDTKTVYSTLNIENSTSNDNARIELLKLTTCKRDADNSVFNLETSTDDGVSSLKLRITGFKSTPQTYTCQQAADNKTAGSVGGKFDTCFVTARVPAAAGGSMFNGYSMYRDEAEKAQAFTYAGTCQITISELSASNAKGVVLCGKMLQTYLNGTLRNPVDAAVTADVRAEFNCPLQ
ncbi:MAG: hypothetical protein RIR26_284 [Pseudomonadota bacterium]|jgi:hypothetical protein